MHGAATRRSGGSSLRTIATCLLGFDGAFPGETAVEVLVWGVPAILAARRALRVPREQRRTWLVVAAACAVIVVDKIVDLQAFAMAAGKTMVHRHAAHLTHHGPGQAARAALLGALFLAGCAGLWFLVRGDRHRSAPKALALAGLVGVMAFLGLRLVPRVAEALGAYGGTLVELACCALVWGGVLSGGRAAEA